MTQSLQSPRFTVLRRVFFDPRELHAGWRLLIFLAIVVTLINASNFTVRRLRVVPTRTPCFWFAR